MNIFWRVVVLVGRGFSGEPSKPPLPVAELRPYEPVWILGP